MERENDQNALREQEHELYDALRHAEDLGLSNRELALLAWGCGLGNFKELKR